MPPRLAYVPSHVAPMRNRGAIAYAAPSHAVLLIVSLLGGALITAPFVALVLSCH